MSENFEKYLEQELELVMQQEQYRSLKSYTSDFVDFSSNDYLGFAKQDYALSVSASGSTGSRLITGNSAELQALEKQIATWKNTEASLFFGSGYLANLGTISALAGPRDVIFSDEYNHSCILDGIRLSGAKKFFYENLNYQHLYSLLKTHRHKYRNAFVISDSVFSMQGTCVDVEKLYELKKDFDLFLYLDEAHATGVFAKNGAGLFAQELEKKPDLKNAIDIQMGTFSKACAVEGAYVAGSYQLIDFLINKARTFIYSTAPAPVVVTLVRKNLQLLINAQDKRKQLHENIKYFEQGLKTIQCDFTHQASPIFAINFSSNQEVLVLSKKLLEQKLLVKAIRPPTVKRPCLRVCIHASHSKEDLDALLAQLAPST